MSILSGIGNSIIFLDGIVGNIYGSAQELKESVAASDTLGIVHHSVEHTNAYANTASTAASITNTGATVSAEAAQMLHFSVNTSAVHFIEKITPAQFLAGIGIFISTLTILTSAISIHRQTEVIDAIPDNATLDDKNELIQVLESLGKMKVSHLKKVVPDHMKELITRTTFSDHIDKINKDEANAISEAATLVKNIKDYVTRKRVVEILTLIGGVIALAASIAALVGCPPLAIIALTAVGAILTVTCLIMNKKWVEKPIEKPDPSTLQAPISATPVPAMLLQPIQQQPQQSTPAPQEPTFWDKFVGFFKN